jgi:hypothetical protein
MQGYLAYLFVPLQRQDNISMYDQVVRHSLHSRSVVMVVVPSFYLIYFFSLIYFKNYLNLYNAADHQCKRLPQNLGKTKKVVKPQPLKKAPAFCIW